MHLRLVVGFAFLLPALVASSADTAVYSIDSISWLPARRFIPRVPVSASMPSLLNQLPGFLRADNTP